MSVSKQPRIIFVAWQDPATRQWFPVGRLSSANGDFTFQYTNGALESKRFTPFGRMTDLKGAYKSTELFPLFANRLLGASRPEFQDFMQWMNLDASNPEPLEALGRSGGIRATDSLEIFPLPTRTEDDKLVTFFFSHGLRHLPQAAEERVASLRIGDRLFILRDIQNPHHPNALAVRTDDPATLVGYCPRYLADDLGLLCSSASLKSVVLTVERINPDAPIQFRLLCRFTCDWPNEFAPSSGPLYQPIAALPKRSAILVAESD